MKEKFLRFMYGRYGVDSLYYALFVLYIVLIVLNVIFDSTIINIIMWLILAVMIFRLMSKNHMKRRRENELYLKFSRPFRTFFTLNFKRIRDIRSKRYRVCKRCHAVIRLPIKKGTHGVVCPKCHNKFNVTIRF